MNKQLGLSLVELMIAITLGLILMTGVMQVFLSSKTVYTTQQALSRVQETGRLAIEFLSRDIRMAGYMGCGSRTATMKVTSTLDSVAYQYDFETGLMGYTADTLPLNHGLAPLPIANTDLFVLRSASGSGAKATGNTQSGQLFVSNTGSVTGACANGDTSYSGICIGDILVISDCSKARVFQALNVKETGSGANDVNVVHSGANKAEFPPGNIQPSAWGATSDEDTFKAGAEILKATTSTYFIGKGASGRPSLWQNTNGVNLELLEGVENMSVRYGIDTNEDYVPDAYRTASAIALADWTKVIAMRVELVVANTEDNVLPETQTYQFPSDADPSSSTVNPGDRRLRQIFTTTVGIRSRSF